MNDLKSKDKNIISKRWGTFFVNNVSNGQGVSGFLPSMVMPHCFELVDNWRKRKTNAQQKDQLMAGGGNSNGNFDPG